MLSETVFGSGEGPAPYWKRINADTAPPADIVRTLRTDVNDLATGLAAMNAQATSLMRGSRPTKEDVAEFERVLIHARQARESLATAAAKVSPRMATPFAVDEELAGFDRAINRAQGLADDLSAARTAEPLAALEPGASRG